MTCIAGASWHVFSLMLSCHCRDPVISPPADNLYTKYDENASSIEFFNILNCHAILTVTWTTTLKGLILSLRFHMLHMQ